MLIKRKEFLQIGSLASASLMIPKFLKAFEKTSLVPSGNKVLVVLQLSGGNDGLNTVIPVRNDIYYQSRPHLGIQKGKALKLTDEVGINPALSFFKELFDDGGLGIMNSVGYPNPDRSHFRSMDIWQSASASNEYVNTGWLGRYLDAQCSGCEKPTQALEIDDVLSLALKGKEIKGLAFRDPKSLFNSSNERYFRQINAVHASEEPVVDYLYKTLRETLSSADYIFEESKLRPSMQIYPSTSFGKDLKTIAS
ncbi:MAG TPA: twin-arginine translocation pathway signal, partial [Hanamia sp.]|nr:twin-arginine translocation pathway signal [Hanamia sp.]